MTFSSDTSVVVQYTHAPHTQVECILILDCFLCSLVQCDKFSNWDLKSFPCSFNPVPLWESTGKFIRESTSLKISVKKAVSNLSVPPLFVQIRCNSAEVLRVLSV